MTTVNSMNEDLREIRREISYMREEFTRRYPLDVVLPNAVLALKTLRVLECLTNYLITQEQGRR